MVIISKLQIISAISPSRANPHPHTHTRTPTRSTTMVFPPSKEAYEALIDEVKALRKRTNAYAMSERRPEVEVQPKTRDRKASRNSWADIYNENTALRKHKLLLGQEVETDDGLEWRVKWGQRGGGLALLGLICYIIHQNMPSIVFVAFAFIFLGLLYYKNYSFVIAKRLLREINVVMILILSLCIWIIKYCATTRCTRRLMDLYMFSSIRFSISGRLKSKKSGVCDCYWDFICIMNINNIYNLTFGDWDQGVVLLEYTIQGNEYTFMKRSVKRSIFIQIMLFSLKRYLYPIQRQEARVDDLRHGKYLSRDGNRLEGSPR